MAGFTVKGKQGSRQLLPWIAGGLLLAVVVTNSWVSDDAFITLRSVQRLLDAGRLEWNPGERVQVFTHPLWAAALAPALWLTKSGWWAAWGLGVAGTGALTVLLARTGASGAILALAGLALSRSVVDFSTSGLENPLVHLLVAGLVLSRRDGVGAGWLAGLALLTRLDAAPLVLPLLVARVARLSWRARARELGITFSLPGLWMLGSLVWFGALLPNPALAKLGGGVPKAEVLSQGVHWLGATAAWDPAGAALIVLGLLVAVRTPGRRAVAVGILLHLGWVVWAGGDFMLGRFATPTIVAAAALLAGTRPSPRALMAGTCGLLALALTGPGPTLAHPPSRSTPDPEDLIDRRGVADERRYYTPGSALLDGRSDGPRPQHRFRRRARGGAADPPRVLTGVGMTGFFASERPLVDRTGVTEPFLARLPARPGARRPGHLYRDIPFGYVEWYADVECPVACRDGRTLCEDVKLASRGAIFAPGRAGAVSRLLVGDLAQILGAARPSFMPTEGPCAP